MTRCRLLPRRNAKGVRAVSVAGGQSVFRPPAFLGAAAVHWLAEPPVPFLRDDACNGNFYETKFRSAVRRFN